MPGRGARGPRASGHLLMPEHGTQKAEYLKVLGSRKHSLPALRLNKQLKACAYASLKCGGVSILGSISPVSYGLSWPELLSGKPLPHAGAGKPRCKALPGRTPSS